MILENTTIRRISQNSEYNTENFNTLNFHLICKVNGKRKGTYPTTSLYA